MSIDRTCIYCGGDGVMANGEPCPIHGKVSAIELPVLQSIPIQYQGVRFDKSFLPEKEQNGLGNYLEELLDTITHDITFYQKNILICSRPNSGKTIWAYTLYAMLVKNNREVPPLRDVIEVRDLFASKGTTDEARLFSEARCAIIKVPRDLQPWLFDSIAAIVERRVRNNGFTIFLYGGTKDDLKQIDRYGVLKSLEGTGAYNTIEIKSF